MSNTSYVSSTHLDRLIHAAQAAQTDDSPAMNEIVRRFEGKAQSIGHSLTRCPDLQQDLANAARLGVVKAVRAHALGRPGFPAYAEKYMRGAALREMTRWVQDDEMVSVIPIDDPETLDDNVVEASLEETVADALCPWGDGQINATILAFPLARRSLMEERYIEDLPLEEIARRSGTSVPAVSQRLATAHRHLLAAIQSESVAA